MKTPQNDHDRQRENSDKYITTNETDKDEVCQSLRNKLRKSNNENAALRASLAELIVIAEFYIPKIITGRVDSHFQDRQAIDRAKSLLRQEDAKTK